MSGSDSNIYIEQFQTQYPYMLLQGMPPYFYYRKSVFIHSLGIAGKKLSSRGNMYKIYYTQQLF